MIEPAAALRRTPSHEARLDTEALFGEIVTVYDIEEGWAWGQLETDGYVGWLSANALAAPGAAPTHKVCVPRTLCFPGAGHQTPAAGGAADGRASSPSRARTSASPSPPQAGIVPVVHLAPLKARAGDFVAVAEMFLNAPYLWGGKTSLGLDCSGLVQVALQAAGIACPRDSDMQELSLGKPVALADMRRGDLMFWKGHVAIARDADTHHPRQRASHDGGGRGRGRRHRPHQGGGQRSDQREAGLKRAGFRRRGRG